MRAGPTSQYVDGHGVTHEVYQAVYDGVLNHDLKPEHYQRGEFLTNESVEQRLRNRQLGVREEERGALDTHGNLQRGMKAHVRVITLKEGQPIFRFASKSSAHRHTGPWWTTKLGFEAILLRLDSAVEGGRQLTLREFARRYSAVAESWNQMDTVFMGVVRRPIRCFMGMGSQQYFFRDPRSTEPNRQQHLHHGNLAQHRERLQWVQAGHAQQLNLESYEDENVQLYLPNLSGHVSTPERPLAEAFLQVFKEWSPEQIDHELHLSKLARRTVHAMRSGMMTGKEARAQRLETICRALGFAYQHRV